MGWLDKIKAAIGQSKDPETELERRQKQAEMEALKRDEQMKVRMPPTNDPR
jgi:hypothetical protein